MDLFGLITFWSLVLAAYSIFPPNIRAKVKLFVDIKFTLTVFALSSILAIYLNLANIFLICLDPKICETYYNLSPIIIYLILIAYGSVALLEIRKSKVSRENIYRFKDSAEILYRKGLSVKEDPEGWSVLIDILYENTENIFRLASQNTILEKVWFGIWIRIIPKDKFIILFNRKESEVSVNENSKLFSLFNNKHILRFRRFISTKMTRGKVNSIYPAIPKSESMLTANTLIERYLLDDNLLKLSVDFKPDYILKILRETKKTKFKTEEIIDKSIKPLLINKSSILYEELYEFNTPDDVAVNSVTNSQLLSIFFDLNIIDKEFINNNHIYSPVIDFIYDHLKSFKPKETDPYNVADKDITTPSSYQNPLIMSIQFYDWIVRIALILNVDWHMWLIVFKDWTKQIAINMTFKGENWSAQREFPTLYYFALYQIVDKLTDWLGFVENSPTIKIHGIEGSVVKNGNIVQNIVETLSFCFKYISNSNLPENYKIYLGNIIWRKYFELLESKREELRPYGELLLKEMINKLTLYDTEFDFSFLKVMLVSLYKFDVIGLHSSNDFKMANEVKQKLLDIAKSEVLPILSYTTSYSKIDERAKKYLGDETEVKSDGIYIASYYRNEKIFSLEDLGITGLTFKI